MDSLGVGEFEIILLGESISLDSTLNVPSDSAYFIKPNAIPAGQTHFPFHLEVDAGIEVNSDSELTLEQMQIIELDLQKDSALSTINTYQGSSLTLQNVLMKGLHYPDTFYTLVNTLGNGVQTSLKMIGCEFYDIENVGFMLTSTHLFVQDTIFQDLSFTQTAIFTIFDNYGSDFNITLQNITIQDGVFADVPVDFTNGFFALMFSATDVIFEDFTIKNIRVMKDFPFFIVSVDPGDYDPRPSVQLRNGKLENIIETWLENSQEEQSGLIFKMQGAIDIDIFNITLDNAVFRYGVFIQGVQYYEGSPLASLRDITIRNTQNAFLELNEYGDVTFEKITVENNTHYSIEISGSVFNLQNIASLSFKDFYCKNNTGNIVFLRQVMNLNLENWDVIDSKIAAEATESKLVNILRKKDQAPIEIDQEASEINIINVNFDGFTEMHGIDSTQQANDTFLIVIISEFGKVYIKDSKWYNIEMGGFMGYYLKHCEISNLTVDVDPNIPASEIAMHRMFQFLEVKDLTIRNSKFTNDKNLILFSLYNIRQSNLYEEIDSSNILLENITVMNNIVDLVDPSKLYSSLFSLQSPLKPVKITFKDSNFTENTILNGLILTEESAAIDIDLLNNHFESNIAHGTGSVLTARSMKRQVNVLNIANNQFIKNTCRGNGGVLSFVSTRHNVTSINNTYIGNTARTLGGVGYISKSDLDYSEKDSRYISNSANACGGVWFMNFRRGEEKQPRVVFKNTTFEFSEASKGGAFYIETGDALFQNCSFKGSNAKHAGGDIYLLALASVKIIDVRLEASSSFQGALLYAESNANELVTIQDSTISQITSRPFDQAIIFLNSGSFVMSGTTFEDISSTVFQFESVSVTLSKIKLNQITCQTDQSFCILQGTNSEFSINDVHLDGITSNKNLIGINSSPTNVNIKNLEMQNIQDGGSQTEIFGLVFTQAPNVKIQDSKFMQVSMSVIKGVDSTLSISDVLFSNEEDMRVLEESTRMSGVVPVKKRRFILLNNSNSVITDTQFIGSTLGTPLNGGAIQLIGSTGSHELLRCTFQGNKAAEGGAISVEGTMTRFNIEDSIFRENLALQRGGAIFYASEDAPTESPVINRVTFEENQATSGGSIYIINSPLQVESSVFSLNHATNGACVASLCSSDQTVWLRNSAFTNNTADLGAVLMAFGDLNFEQNQNAFTNNIATYGQDINTKPICLKLKVYQVDEAFLHIDRISTDYMKSHRQTKIVYDSQNSSLQQPLVMKTGVSPNFVFEFTVLDELNQTFTQIKDMSLKIGQEEVRIMSSGDSVSLFGETTYNFNQGLGNIFNSFSTRGAFGNQIIFVVRASVHDSLLNQAYDLAPVELPIKIGICSVGEIYAEDLQVCNPCKQNSFSFDDPLTAGNCAECLKGAVCRGGNTVYPHSGYWRMNALSDNFVKCLNPAACIGGEQDEGRNISLTGFCAEGYEGIGCSICSPGYVKHGADHACMSCSADYMYHIRYFVFLAIQIVMTIITVRSHLLSSDLSPKERESGVLQASLTKVIIDFLHVLNLALGFNLNWPTQVLDFMDFSSEATPNNNDVFSLECIISSIRGTNENIFFVKLVILTVQPLVFIFISYLVWAIIYKTHKIQITNSKDFIARLILTTSIIVYILQPDLLKSTFQLFNCHNYGSTQAPRRFLIEDTNVECWGSQHVLWVLALGIPSLTIWLILPCLAVLSLIWRTKLVQSENFRAKYNFIFEKYNPTTFYWEVIVLLRKVVLIIISVFLTYAYAQAYLSFLTLVFAYLLQKRFNPYSASEINNTEKLSLYVSSFIMYTGLFFVRENPLDPVVPLLFILDIIAGVIFFCFCIYVLKTIVKKKLAIIQEKLDQVIEKKDFKWKTIQNAYRRVKIWLGDESPKSDILEFPVINTGDHSGIAQTKQTQKKKSFALPAILGKRFSKKDDMLVRGTKSSDRASKNKRKLGSVQVSSPIGLLTDAESSVALERMKSDFQDSPPAKGESPPGKGGVLRKLKTLMPPKKEQTLISLDLDAEIEHVIEGKFAVESRKISTLSLPTIKDLPTNRRGSIFRETQ